MPDITLSPTPTDGYISSADSLTALFYAPSSPPNSFEVMNGWLDNANRKPTWSIQRDHIRSGACTGGGMVGLTGNLDYLESLFPTKNTDPGAYVPIPGASISFRLPFSASVVLFTWQIVITNDSPLFSSKDNVTELKMMIDGVAQDGQFRVAPDSTDNRPDSPDALASYNRLKIRERIWSGHWLRALTSDTQVLDAGWHSAHISIFNLAPNARVRIRNMKYMYWR